jgi:hypothetical protein
MRVGVELGLPWGLLGGFLAAYFVLLFFCFSVFVFQGVVGLLVGLTSLLCLCVFFFGKFVHINYPHHTKCLKDVSLDNVRYSGEEKARANLS